MLPELKGEMSFLASQAPLRKTRLQIALLPTEPHAHTIIHTMALGRKPGTGIACLEGGKPPSHLDGVTLLQPFT